jgi:hypothetical protein
MLGHIRKIILVVFISALIWIWADEALTRETSVPATVAVDKSTGPELWVNFDLQPTVPIRLRLSGPASKIDALERRLKEGSLKLEFFLNPKEEKLTAGSHPFALPELLKRNRLIADQGLQIESVEPATINVDVVGLSKKTLSVQALTDNQTSVQDTTIEPATVEMFVPENWNGAKLKATVVLTPQEIEQARAAGIWRRPAVEFATGVLKTADTQVKITLPTNKQRLKDFVIDGANIGYTFSPNLAGKYGVELINQNQILGPIKIQATDEAALAYRNTPFKVILDISDDDAKIAGDLPPRAVVFNLPPEYVRKGEIIIAELEPRMAKFKLVPLETIEKPTVVTP